MRSTKIKHVVSVYLYGAYFLFAAWQSWESYSIKPEELKNSRIWNDRVLKLSTQLNHTDSGTFGLFLTGSSS